MKKVSVLITTYNLDKYISQALDSVINQNVDFDYDIIIADDCSEDNTVKILEEYKSKYPEKIKLLLSDKNMGSLSNSNRLFDKIDSEYISFLDGDDYWIGEDRLKIQVNFLDKNPNYYLCAGNTIYKGGANDGKMLLKHKDLNRSYDFNLFLKDKVPFFHTSSLLLRNDIFRYGMPKPYYELVGTYEECAPRGEDFRRILHLEKGPLFAFDSVFSCYRIHENGLWQGSSVTKREIESAIGLRFYDKYFGDRYGAFFHKKAMDGYRNLIKNLALNNNIFQNPSMHSKDLWLFTNYFKDICMPDNKKYELSKLKKIILKIFFKIVN